MVNLYQVLGVSPDADGAEIKVAFRTLAKVITPISTPGTSLLSDAFKPSTAPMPS
jgi:curved DNA-binding protein CbpA